MAKYIILSFVFSSMTLFSQNIDIKLLREINLNRNTHLDKTFRGISNSMTPVSIGMPLMFYGISMITKDTLMREKSVYMGLSLISAATVTAILKYSINRPRPYITYPDLEKETGGGSSSFPSGHTSDAFALATSISLTYPKWYVILPSYVWAVAVGYSRMDLGVHYPSDVLAGAIIGTGTAFLCYKGQQWLNKKRK
jgi:membrane-associated phospholipid phosphatase